MRAPFLLILVVFLGAQFLGGCGQDTSARNYCPNPEKYGVNADQKNSFMVPMDIGQTYTLSIDPRFSTGAGSQQEQIIDAATVWNAYSRKQMNYRFFVTQTAPVVGSQIPAYARSCEFAAPGGPNAFHVVRVESDVTWSSLNLTGNMPAATLRCYDETRLTKQVVLVNTRHTDAQQFMTIVLHELGHAVGLEHSCDGDNRGVQGFGGCSGIGPGHSYFDALMFPIFRVASSSGGVTDIKESLRTNDLNRTNCLYGGG